jgi:hypothetical protein
MVIPVNRARYRFDSFSSLKPCTSSHPKVEEFFPLAPTLENNFEEWTHIDKSFYRL